MYHYSDLSSMGEKTLAVGAAAMLLSSVCFYMYAVSAKVSRALLQTLCMAICAFAGISYTVMAMGHGYVVINDRPVYWIRYVDWLITTPLLLFDICKIAGSPTSQTIMFLLLDIIMVLSGVAAAVLHSWFLFIVGCFAFVPILLALVGGLNKQAALAPPDVKSVLTRLCWLTAVTWVAYPVVWVVCEGLRVVSIDTEIVIYAILDITAKCGFGFILCSAKSAVEKASIRDEE